MSETTVYTDEIVERMTEGYTALVDTGASYEARSEFVKEMADELGVKEASVRAKLVSLKIYVAKERAKEGSTGRTKEQIAAAFSAVIGKDVSSLAKASKADLDTLWQFYLDINSRMELDAEDVA